VILLPEIVSSKDDGKMPVGATKRKTGEMDTPEKDIVTLVDRVACIAVIVGESVLFTSGVSVCALGTNCVNMLAALIVKSPTSPATARGCAA